MLGTLVGTAAGRHGARFAFRAAWSTPCCRGATVAWSAWLLGADGRPAHELGGHLALTAGPERQRIEAAVQAAIEASVWEEAAPPADRLLPAATG